MIIVTGAQVLVYIFTLCETLYTTLLHRAEQDPRAARRCTDAGHGGLPHNRALNCLQHGL